MPMAVVPVPWPGQQGGACRSIPDVPRGERVMWKSGRRAVLAGLAADVVLHGIRRGPEVGDNLADDGWIGGMGGPEDSPG